MCQECVDKCVARVTELTKARAQRASADTGVPTRVCVVSHAYHSHMRFATDDNAGRWHSLPYGLGVLLAALAVPGFDGRTYSVHRHSESTMFPTKASRGIGRLEMRALEGGSLCGGLLTALRRPDQDTCGICLDAMEGAVRTNSNAHSHSSSVVAETDSKTSEEGEGKGATAAVLPNVVTLPCGHAYHHGCCAEWFNVSVECPTCRGVVDIQTLDDAQMRGSEVLHALEEENKTLENKTLSKQTSAEATKGAGEGGGVTVGVGVGVATAGGYNHVLGAGGGAVLGGGDREEGGTERQRIYPSQSERPMSAPDRAREGATGRRKRGLRGRLSVFASTALSNMGVR